MKKVLFRIGKWFSHNLWYKLIAIFFASILWSFVIADTNPLTKKSIEGNQVVFRNEKILGDNGLIIRGGLKNLKDGVAKVEVETSMREARYVTTDSVSAYIDVGRISEPGTYDMQIKADVSAGARATKFSPSTVTVEVDKFSENRIPVQANIIGKIPEGYHHSEPSFMPSVIVVKGAQMDVSRVQKAVCDINLNDLKTDLNNSLPVKFYDADNQEIVDGTFSDASQSVVVEMQVLPMKVVPIDAEAAINAKDSVADGFEYTGYSCTPDKVTIAGKNIDDIKSIKLENINIQNAKQNVQEEGKPILPDGVDIVNGTKIVVVAFVSEKKESKSFKNLPITVTSLKNGLTAAVDTEGIDVEISGRQNVINSLKSESIKLFVDAFGLEAGVYTLDVKYELPKSLSDESVSLSKSKVIVTITQSK